MQDFNTHGKIRPGGDETHLAGDIQRKFRVRARSLIHP
jgi:hypothetical protein